tara:strand:- start:21 stop:1181 length:1161 start_codon:yes stop_codon:yes gene_type:complete
MAYQSPENAQKLRDMPRVATNNAEPMVQAVTQSLPSTETSSESGINWGAIGEGLRGFGAGYDGRGTEFIAGLNKQNERLDKSRQQAMLKDLSRLDGLLSEGSFNEARQLLVNRVGLIDKFGGNSGDTKGLLNLMNEGKNDEVRKIVSREIGTAVDMGLIKQRAAARTIEVYNEETGQNEIRVLSRDGQLGEVVGQAKRGEGTTVNIDNAVKPWSQIVSRYDKQMKTVNAAYKDIQRVQSALKTKGGASPKALQAAIADIFGGNTRAIANLQQWASFGNLPDDLINKAKKFALGDYTDLAKNDISRLLASYQEYNGEEHQAINDRFTKVANANKVDLDTIISEVKPFPKSYDFLSMTTDELSKVPLDTLLGYQRTDFKNALDRIAGQ